MQEFINNVLKYRDGFVQIGISYGETKSIQDFVVKSLNLKNLKDLRDRHEGLVFLKIFTTRIVGVIGIKKMLKLKPIDWTKINPRDYESVLEIESSKIQIISSVYGELPVIEKNNSLPAIFLLNRDNKYIFVCGFASVKTLNNEKNTKPLKNRATKSINTKVNFIGFENLEKFDSIQELTNIMK